MTTKRPVKKPVKRKSRFLSFLLIFFLCALIGISIGLGLYYTNNTDIKPDIHAIAQVAQDTSTNITSIIEGVVTYFTSEEFRKFLPTLQGIITTVAAVLGIIATVKNLKKKD